jgi:hypothetical protein
MGSWGLNWEIEILELVLILWLRGLDLNQRPLGYERPE